jgi:hypothetical protein
VTAPATAVSGQALAVSWTIQNVGDAMGNRSWYDSVYLSRDQIFDRSSDLFLGSVYHNGRLAHGDSYTGSQSFTIPAGRSGSYHVFVAADSGAYLSTDPNRTNNVAYKPTATQVTLPPPVDLAVGTITIPSNGTPGENATITYLKRLWAAFENRADQLFCLLRVDGASIADDGHLDCAA